MASMQDMMWLKKIFGEALIVATKMDLCVTTRMKICSPLSWWTPKLKGFSCNANFRCKFGAKSSCLRNRTVTMLAAS